jgi:hypothetical protein
MPGSSSAVRHGRSGTVAEQHAGATIAPVDHSGQGFGTDHQHVSGSAVANVLIGHRQGVDEAGAGRIDVERSALGHAETVLQQAGGGRKHHVGGGRADQQQIDVARLQSGRLHGLARSLLGQVASGLTLGGDMALRDAGAFANPLVAGIDHFLEIRVGQDLLGQVPAGSDDARVHAVLNSLNHEFALSQ